MKKIIKSIIFILLFAIIAMMVKRCIWLFPTTITKFYEEPRNSLDVVYIGASNAYAHFNTVLTYDKFGYKVGMMSTDAQPLAAVKYLMEEARKRQNPKVYVVDITSSSSMYIEEGNARTILDSIPLSLNRLRAVNGILKYSIVPKEDYINYYFSFLKYHVLWKNISQAKIKNDNVNLFKGTLFYHATAVITPVQEVPWNDEIYQDIPKQLNEVLLDLIEYIKKENIPVLFVISPRALEENNIGILNNMVGLLEENDLKVLNLYKKADEIGIDFSHDLYNYGHLNVYGQTKFTLYLADYLKNNYNIQSSDNDDESWKEAYENFKMAFKNVCNADFEEYLQELENDNTPKKS